MLVPHKAGAMSVHQVTTRGSKHKQISLHSSIEKLQKMSLSSFMAKLFVHNSQVSVWNAAKNTETKSRRRESQSTGKTCCSPSADGTSPTAGRPSASCKRTRARSGNNETAPKAGATAGSPGCHGDMQTGEGQTNFRASGLGFCRRSAVDWREENAQTRQENHLD